MKLERSETIGAMERAGLWHRRTLDASLSYFAANRGENLALADAADRAHWTGGQSVRLNYAAFDQAVSRAATAFEALGLEPGSVIALQSPATTDALIALYGAWRAGLIACPLPVVWRRRDLVPVLKQIGARAVIVADRYGDEALALEMRDVAAEIFTIRYVFGIGSDLPDGLIDLSGLCAEMEAAVARPPVDANAVASVSMRVGGDGRRVVIPRTHNHWLATARYCRAVYDDYPGPVLSTYDPSSYGGFVAGLLTPLSSGRPVALHRYSGPSAFCRSVSEAEPAIAVVPAALSTLLLEALGAETTRPAALAVVGNERTDAECPTERECAVMDITTIADLGIHAAVRPATSEQRQSIPIGTMGLSETATGLLQTRVRARMQKASASTSLLGGEVQLRGAMVPTMDWPRGNEPGFGPLPAGGDGFVSTDIACNFTDGNMAGALLNGRLSEVAAVGNQFIVPAELDRLYAEVATVSDAAVAFEEHPVSGCRLTAIVVPAEGALVDRASFCDQLKALGAPRHVFPERLVSVFAIPRGDDGEIVRELLVDASSDGGSVLVA